MWKISLLIFALLTAIPLQAQKVDEYNVPEAVTQCWAKKKYEHSYEISGSINPFYLRGDFNGDAGTDYAILITEKRSGKRGLAICFGGTVSTAILGAGKEFNEADEFMLEAWQVYGKRSVSQGGGEGPPPRLLGEAILVEWPERASGLIYWNGKKFVWYQQGD